MQIVIPAFNEARRLPRTLTDLRARASELRSVVGDVEVIVVDNASTDRTAAVAAQYDCAELPVRVIRCDRPGKGAAVRVGFAASDHDVVAFMDADGATSLNALAEGWRLVTSGADVAIGSRAVAGAITHERHTWVRARGAALFRFASNRVVPGIADTQCGFKVLRGDLARLLAMEMVATGFSFDVELLARARRHRARLCEFAVEWTDVPGSTFVPSRHGAGAFVELAAIAWRVRRPLPVPVVRVLPGVSGTFETFPEALHEARLEG